MATMTLARARAQHGQAVIEMALTLPLLLLIVFGIFDFGFMFQQYEVVTNAAREAARIGVLRDSGNYTETQAEDRAIAYLAASGIGASGTRRAAPCNQALQPNSWCVDVTFPAPINLGGTPPQIINQVTAVVQYDHEHVFVGPIMSLFGGNLATVRLTAVSTMRLE
jgi:hypothetical protein